MNILENYTNEQRKEFMKTALLEKKRIEKIGDKLFALSDNQIVENGQIVTDNERPQRLRQEEFEKQFFHTSVGWVSRKVHMQTGDIWDFLKDIKPSLKIGVSIITYTPNQDYTELNQNKNVTVTEEFLNECEQQILKDFYGE